MKAAFLTIFLVLFFPAISPAKVTGFDSGQARKSLTSKDLIPKLEKGKAYSERYTFTALLDDGGEVYLEMTISNFGWGNFSAATTTRIELAGETPYEHKETLKADEWSYSSSRFQMTMGQSSVEVVREGLYRLRHSGEVEYELEFRNILPSWRPGTGEVRSGKDYFRIGLIAPRAAVSGRVKIDGKWVEVKSRQGMSDWSVTTIAPFDLASEFGRFRAVKGDVYVAWRNIKLSEDFGGQDVSWVVVGKGNQIIFADAGAKIERSNLKLDKTSKYEVPHQITIHGTSGADTLKLTLQSSGKYQVIDLLNSYGSVTRFLAARFTKPFQFNSFGRWNLELNQGPEQVVASGRGPLGLDILNP